MSLPFSGMSQAESINYMLTKLNSLRMNFDKLRKVQEKSNNVINTADLLTLVNDKIKNELLVACRSITNIFPFFPCLTIDKNSSHQGLSSTDCGTTLNCGFDYGVKFDHVETMPSSFSRLKISVKQHTQNATHLSNVEKNKFRKTIKFSTSFRCTFILYSKKLNWAVQLPKYKLCYE